MKNLLILIFLSITVTACSTARINKIELDMARKDVIKKMGEPDSISGKEYLIYSSKKAGKDEFNSVSEEYYILLIDGKAVAYGPKSELETLTPATPSLQKPLNNKEKQKKPSSPVTNKKTTAKKKVKKAKGISLKKLSSELKKIKKQKDSGIISEKEFDKKKKELLKEY